MDTAGKLSILADAARYDVACTSSGVDRDAKLGHLGSTMCAGICHSFSADGRCITLLKVLYSNACIYDCAYCANRCSNDIPRASFSPRELADLTIEFYRRNFIEGLFLSSAVVESPDHTMELICSCLSILRGEYGFNGYIHAKAIPGASPALIERMGMLADRVSVNIELPSVSSLRVLAPDKEPSMLTGPMGLIAERIQESSEERRLARRAKPASFAPAGQSTQLIIGATPETDNQILRLSSALYRTYSMKRVFFSAYLPVNSDVLLPDQGVSVPLDREHRLYQADWLMRFYGFDVEELVDDGHPFLNPLIDPKAQWALNHLELFPVEVNTAPYEMLLRIPGLGVRGAKMVQRARRHTSLTPEKMRRMGLSLKRMQYFVTFSGRYHSPLPFDREAIFRQLALDADASGKHQRGGGKKPMTGQLPLFDEPELDCRPLEERLSDGSAGFLPPAFQAGQVRAFDAQRHALEAMTA